MTVPPIAGATHELAVEAYGIRVAVGANDADLLERLAAVLPPLGRPCDPADVHHRFALFSTDGFHRIEGPGIIPGSGSADLEVAVGMLDSSLRAQLAGTVPDRVFVHAGAVAHAGHAIVLPGRSLSGKTTLVTALLAAGAEYLSEEYAVLDEDGRVHPYPKALAIRAGRPRGVATTPESLGATVATGSFPVGIVAVTRYQGGATWNPDVLSPAAAVIAMLEHTIAAQERDRMSLAYIRAAAPPVAFEGVRGEAEQAADALLAAVEALAA